MAGLDSRKAGLVEQGDFQDYCTHLSDTVRFKKPDPRLSSRGVRTTC